MLSAASSRDPSSQGHRLLEQYALEPERRKDMVEGIPFGTSDYYLYQLRLRSQRLQDSSTPVTAEEIDEALKFLRTVEDSNRLNSSELDKYRKQFALLGYTVKPELLHKELNFNPHNMDLSDTLPSLDTNDDSPAPENVCDVLPTSLDQTLLQPETLTKKILDALENNRDYSTYIPATLWPHLLAQPEMESILLEKITVEKSRNLLANFHLMPSPSSLKIIGRTEDNRVDELIVKWIDRLFSAKAFRFDNAPFLSKLTNAQLEKLLVLSPELLNDEGFVGQLEKRITPRPFTNERDKESQKEWISRMIEFVERLSPKFNRHKLSVYQMSLVFDLDQGVMDREKFMRYIAIPRLDEVYSKALSQQTKSAVDLRSHAPLNYWSNRVQTASSAKDTEILKEYLMHFLIMDKSPAAFEQFFEVGFLHPLFGTAMLTAGDPDIEKWSRYLAKEDARALVTLTYQSLLEFSPSNPATFLPSDPVVFKLRVKNMKSIHVRVFEVKTLEYLLQYGSEPAGQSLNLDGLSPNWEHTIEVDSVPLKIEDVTVNLPELANRRGAFVMDVIGDGQNITSYFTKGYHDFVERRTVAGHVLTIIDENQQMVTDNCSPEQDGDILIPYRKEYSTETNYIYIIQDGFATRRPFMYKSEAYNMDLMCHVEHESLIAGSTAKILLKPIVRLQPASVTCPVSLLQQVTLEVEYTDSSHTTSKSSIADFKLDDTEWSVYDFRVPENLVSLRLELRAKIKSVSAGELVDLSAEYRDSYNSPTVDSSVTVEHRHQTHSVQVHGEVLPSLRKCDTGYQILLVGKNGERRPKVPVHLMINHPLAIQTVTVYLCSDKNGLVHLGPLKGAVSVNCVSAGQMWTLSEHNKTVYPSTIRGFENEPINLPVGEDNEEFIRSISFFSQVSDSASQCVTMDDLTANVKLQYGLLSIHNLKAGYYNLKIGDSSVEITIFSASNSSNSISPELRDYNLASNPMVEIPDSAKHPLYMPPVATNLTNQSVDIQVCNWTPLTRVSVIATRFVPYQTILSDMEALPSDAPWLMRKAELTKTSFRTGRVLSEEYQYVLNRKSQKNHWAGNFLSKPSLLLAPWAHADTTMSEQKMADEDRTVVTETTARGFGSGYAARSANYSGAFGSMHSDSRTVPSFLAHPSVVLANLEVDQTTGLLSIPFEQLKGTIFLQIVVTDGTQALQRTFSLPATEALVLETRDLRFKSALDYRNHYIGEREGVPLDPKKLNIASTSSSSVQQESASIALATSGSSTSSIRVISSVSELYDLMSTVLQADADKTLRKFDFIKSWSTLSNSSKEEKYASWSCHELNLFLFKKDRAFFDATVAPFIKNKLVRSFLDDYLIGVSLEKYTDLRSLDALTCLEKCLLAQRISRMKSVILQWFKARVFNRKVANDVKLFRTIMKSAPLEDFPEFDDLPKKKAKKKSTSLDNSLYQVDEDCLDSFECCEAIVEIESYPQDSLDLLLMDSCYRSSIVIDEQVETSLPPGAVRVQAGCSPASLSYSPSSPSPVTSMGGSSRRVSRVASVLNSRSAQMAFAQTMSVPPPPPSAAITRAEQIVRQQFKPVDLTKEMAETYYYERRDFRKEDKSTPNAFWLDYLEWDEAHSGSFLSQNFLANAGSFTDAMATLALMDVEFTPKDVLVTRSADRNLVVSSRSPAVVFHSSTKVVEDVLVDGSVIVTQQYFLVLERDEYDPKLGLTVRRYLKPGTKLRPLESYGVHTVVMNSTPYPKRLQLECQLPTGAIAIYGELVPEHDINLGAHGKFEYEYQFYFPAEGDYSHYPAHVSDYDNIVAYSGPTALHVRTIEPEGQVSDQADEAATWNYVFSHGSQERVLEKLSKSVSLESIPVEILIPRLYRDKEFLIKVTDILRDRGEFNQRIWGVSLVQSNKQLLKEYIANQDIVHSVPEWFTSPLLTCRPELLNQIRSSFHYLEYFPLINAR
ncbi:hypothetical protein BGW38_001324, partial [Lunasporangiospora selenospora]